MKRDREKEIAAPVQSTHIHHSLCVCVRMCAYVSSQLDYDDLNTIMTNVL